jgi:hypothetical protein
LGSHATAQTSQAKIESLYFLRNAKKYTNPARACRDMPGPLRGSFWRDPARAALQQQTAIDVN